MDLYFWSPGDSPRQLGWAQLVGFDFVLQPEAEPAFAEAVAAVLARPTLPLITRRRSGEGEDLRREVTIGEVAPGDPDHWVALTDVLAQETGCVLTLTSEPPA